MRVAYVLPSLQPPSGWRTLCRGVLENAHPEVEALIFAPAAFVADARQLFPGKPVFALPHTQEMPLSRRLGLPYLLATWLAIRRGQYPQADIVHSLEAYPTGAAGMLLARHLSRPGAQVPLVLTANGTYGVVWKANLLDRRLYSQVLQRASLVCPISHGTAQQMQAHFGSALAHTPLRPVLLGTNFAQRVPAQQALERSAPPIPTLLSVGDVKSRKGQHISLAAYAKVKEQLPQARYWIVGRYKEEADSYYSQLQRWVAGHHLQDVYFLGAVSDAELQERYRDSSLFVLAPQQEGLHFEGFGLVYIEAGAYGLPVVGTCTGGVPDAIRDGETGLVVPPNDSQALAQVMLRLLNNPSLARQMGQANRRWAEWLTWERCTQTYYQAYQALLSGPAALKQFVQAEGESFA